MNLPITPPMIGPDIPAHLLPQISPAEQDETSDDEGPEPTPLIGPQITSSIGPQVPSSLSTVPGTCTGHQEEDEEEDDYAPALPPELVAVRAKKVLGPSFPPSVSGPTYDDGDGGDDDDNDVGPRPLPQGVVLEEKDGVQEFLEREERRRKHLEVCASCPAPSRPLRPISTLWIFDTWLNYFDAVCRRETNPKRRSERSGCSSRHPRPIFLAVSIII